jgi:catechol 2,3-dioxygenase-like lactoylglutathione lyase family enzyme
MLNTKIRHVATMSENCPRLAKFYEAVFGMKRFKSGPEPDDLSLKLKPKAITVSDGYVGFNFNPRKPGRPAALDHFGFEVDNAQDACARLRDKYPEVKVLSRPSNRPFAGLTTHDPAGNIFDLSQKQMINRRDVYVAEGWTAQRSLHHFVLRVLDPPSIARFYKEIFELEEQEKALEDPNIYLSDRRVTMVIAPWDITNFKGTGIERPSMDHLGFKVESIAAVKSDLEELANSDPTSAARPVGVGPESEARLALLSTCRYGESQLSDPDCVFIDIHA